MRQRLLVIGAGLLSVGLFFGGSDVAEGQSTPSAATVASWVDAFYGQTQQLSATFRQRYRNRVYQRTDSSTGRIRFRRPGMMRFDYNQPNGKIVVSDGQRLTVYEPPGAGQRHGQYYQQSTAGAQLPAALGFLTGTSHIGRDYRHRLLDARARHYAGQVLELRPRRPSPHYTRILLYIDDDPSRRGVIHRILIVDHSNNENRFDLSDQDLRTAIPDSAFRFRPPRGARRIQAP